jgi:peptidoglycan/xylan/chitin deacetylase (PgdA/CDA1 family)
MVLTFDDLPYVAEGYPDTISRGTKITVDLIDTLARHGAPTTAFVNESKLYIDDQTEARIGLLEQWVEYGAVLGSSSTSRRLRR